jgi:hypothetical protein
MHSRRFHIGGGEASHIVFTGFICSSCLSLGGIYGPCLCPSNGGSVGPWVPMLKGAAVDIFRRPCPAWENRPSGRARAGLVSKRRRISNGPSSRRTRIGRLLLRFRVARNENESYGPSKLQPPHRTALHRTNVSLCRSTACELSW